MTNKHLIMSPGNGEYITAATTANIALCSLVVIMLTSLAGCQAQDDSAQALVACDTPADLTPASATARPVSNRAVAAIAVLARNDDTHDIQGVITISSQGIVENSDESFRVETLINDTVVAAKDYTIEARPSARGCTGCLRNQECICHSLPSGLQSCICGGFTLPTEPYNTRLPANAVVTMRVTPLPGTLPDPDAQDDSSTQDFEGKDIYWDREIRAVRAVPTASSRADAGLFDVIVDLDVKARYEGPLDTAAEIVLVVNGTTAGRRYRASDSLYWNPCGQCKTGCARNPDGVFTGICEIQGPPLNCECTASHAGTVFEAILLQPGDVIEVEVVPVAGALPELPGREDNDDRTLVLGDLTGTVYEPFRTLDSIRLIPDSATGGQKIVADMKYGGAGEGTTGINLSTEVDFIVNGRVMETVSNLIFAQEVQGSCFSSCGPCSATCFVGVPVYGCACGRIISFTSSSHAIEPGDEVEVVLSPAVALGGISESYSDDNTRCLLSE